MICVMAWIALSGCRVDPAKAPAWKASIAATHAQVEALCNALRVDVSGAIDQYDERSSIGGTVPETR